MSSVRQNSISAAQQLRRTLHHYPELDWQERRTAEPIRRERLLFQPAETGGHNWPSIPFGTMPCPDKGPDRRAPCHNTTYYSSNRLIPRVTAYLSSLAGITVPADIA